MSVTTLPGRTGSQLLGPGEGELIEARGVRVVIKAASAGLLVCDYTVPGHFPGPPLHVHPGFDECFLIAEGELAMRLQDETSVLSPGASAYVSGSTPHTFANPGPRPARFLLVCSPGGWEHYFRGVATGDAALVAAISERFGYQPVAPA